MNRKRKTLALAVALGLGLLVVPPASAARSAKPRRPGFSLRTVWAAATAWWGGVRQVKDGLAIDPNGVPVRAEDPARSSTQSGSPPASEGGLAIDPDG